LSILLNMPRSIVSSFVPEVVFEKNTFIEVAPEGAAQEDELPRTISDQTHARNKHTKFIATIPSIIEGHDFAVEPPTRDMSPVSKCRWHSESSTMGVLSEDGRTFTKFEFDGRLSMLTDDKVKDSGVHRYLVHIDDNTENFSAADGFGFVFGDRLPCRKNIQKIDSIFINKRGQICTRVHNLPTVKHAETAPLDVGKFVDIVVDLDKLSIAFSVLDRDLLCLGSAAVEFGATTQITGKKGFFCAVVKHAQTSLTFR
jgi:hypothetical protein